MVEILVNFRHTRGDRKLFFNPGDGLCGAPDFAITSGAELLLRHGMVSASSPATKVVIQRFSWMCRPASPSTDRLPTHGRKRPHADRPIAPNGAHINPSTTTDTIPNPSLSTSRRRRDPSTRHHLAIGHDHVHLALGKAAYRLR